MCMMWLFERYDRMWVERFLTVVVQKKKERKNKKSLISIFECFECFDFLLFLSLAISCFCFLYLLCCVVVDLLLL